MEDFSDRLKNKDAFSGKLLEYPYDDDVTYAVLERYTFQKLKQRVNEPMLDGWQPIGAPFTFMEGDDDVKGFYTTPPNTLTKKPVEPRRVFCQALVRAPK